MAGNDIQGRCLKIYIFGGFVKIDSCEAEKICFKAGQKKKKLKRRQKPTLIFVIFFGEADDFCESVPSLSSTGCYKMFVKYKLFLFSPDL